ncbi:HTH-type transcriptional repressor BepR [Bacteroidales bacterium Barb6XT]|nr:HTH-type transcriptional repressor BepR [Bacteroidales bacterium Barb6XT]
MRAHDSTDMETRIVEAAKQIFVRKGYNQATMSDIAAEAGIGRTALHYYYRTKEMLFDAVFGQLMDSLLPNIQKIMESDGTMLDKYPQIIEQYTAVLKENLLFPVFVINEMNRDPEHLYCTILKYPQRIEPLLKLRRQTEEEMEKGILRKISLMNVISAVIGILVFPILAHNPLSNLFLDGDKEKFKAFIAGRVPFVTDMVMKMLTPESEEREKAGTDSGKVLTDCEWVSTDCQKVSTKSEEVSTDNRKVSTDHE